MKFENMYGSGRRLHWIMAQLQSGQRVVEFGCGTGQGILVHLLKADVDATGYDLDGPSIEAGREWLAEAGLGVERLQCADLRTANEPADVVIASEVFEHMEDSVLDEALTHIFQVLVPGGILLATVPNGQGWFEWETRLAKWTGIGWLVNALRIHKPLDWIRRRLLGDGYIQWHWRLTSLSDSPHVQRFSLASFQARLMRAGFEVERSTGSSFVCGPITQTLFAGLGPVMRWNNWMAQKFPRRASGFMVISRRP